MKSSRFVFMGLIAALSLAGCTPGPHDQGSPPPSLSSPTPEPTPTQARETGLVPPAQVFGGDCSRLFTTDEVSDLMDMELSGASWEKIYWMDVPYLEQLGGIRCNWSADGAFISLVALPEAAISYPASTDCDLSIEAGITGCALEATENGIRLSGGVFRMDQNNTALQAAQEGLLDLFFERAQGANLAPLPIPAPGAWAWPVDCASVVAAGDFSAVPGFGTAATGGQAGGSDAYFPAAEIAIRGDFSPPYCDIYNDDVEVIFNAVGGGRWGEATAAAFSGATTTQVDGIDRVVLSPSEYGLTRVDAFDGPNWVSFFVRYPANAGVLAQALVAALDSTSID